MSEKSPRANLYLRNYEKFIQNLRIADKGSTEYEKNLVFLEDTVNSLIKYDPECAEEYKRTLAEFKNGNTKTLSVKSNSVNNNSSRSGNYSSDRDNKGTTNSGTKNSQKNDPDNTETEFTAAEIPNISFDDVAGLEDVKESVRMRVLLPMKYPDVYEMFDKDTGGGILLYGLPGTGKTMIAKAIAHEVGAKFYSIKCSDIVSKWVGEAEKNVKNLFATARQEERAIIFFDEFEAIGAKRSDENKTSAKLIPELLAQIQGFEDKKQNTLLLLAATNRPWDIDSALLRPGRFNELIYVSLPDRPARKYMINKILNGKKPIPMDNDVNIDDIVDATEGFSGADIKEFCDRMKAYSIKTTIEAREHEGKDIIVKISKKNVDYAKNLVKSSIQKADIIAIKKFAEENKRDIKNI